MTIRIASLDDAEKISKFDNSIWPNGVSTENMKCRIATFSEGNWIAIHDGEIVGYVCFQRIDVPSHEIFTTWYAITDNGKLTNSHKPKGQYMFMVNSTVSPNSPRNTYSLLLCEIVEYGVRNRLKGLYSGIRSPGFKSFKEKNPNISSAEYIQMKDEKGSYIDPMVDMYSRRSTKIIKVLPDYFIDEDSLDNGVLVYRSNPYSWIPSIIFEMLGKTIIHNIIIATMSSHGNSVKN